MSNHTVSPSHVAIVVLGLAECQVFVRADGYSAYDWLGKSEGSNASARLIGCNMHGR